MINYLIFTWLLEQNTFLLWFNIDNLWIKKNIDDLWLTCIISYCGNWYCNWSSLTCFPFLVEMKMQAFEATWGAACKVEASTMLIPADYTFYVGPIVFSGPYCKPRIVFQVAFFLHERRVQLLTPLYLLLHQCVGSHILEVYFLVHIFSFKIKLKTVFTG